MTGCWCVLLDHGTTRTKSRLGSRLNSSMFWRVITLSQNSLSTSQTGQKKSSFIPGKTLQKQSGVLDSKLIIYNWALKLFCCNLLNNCCRLNNVCASNNSFSTRKEKEEWVSALTNVITDLRQKKQSLKTNPVVSKEVNITPFNLKYVNYFSIGGVFSIFQTIALSILTIPFFLFFFIKNSRYVQFLV